MSKFALALLLLATAAFADGEDHSEGRHEFFGNLIPANPHTLSIGTSDAPWAGFWVDSINDNDLVIPPASSTDNAAVRFNGITGLTLQNSLVLIDDLGAITGVTDVTMTGNLNSRDPDDLVKGPASATDNAVARFDATTGKLVQDSVVIATDTGAVSGITDITMTGNLNSRDPDDLVKGPASATDGRVVVYDGIGGKTVKDGTKTEADLVTGPASATDNAIVRFDSTTGKVTQDSVAILGDAGALSGLISITGAASGFSIVGSSGGFFGIRPGTGQTIGINNAENDENMILVDSSGDTYLRCEDPGDFTAIQDGNSDTRMLVSDDAVTVTGFFSVLNDEADATLIQVDPAGSPGDVLIEAEDASDVIQFRDGGGVLRMTISDAATEIAIVGDVSVTGNVDDVDVSAHASRHQNGGADEVSVSGLSGTLADYQTGALKILADADAIGDWIAVTQTTPTNVDVTDDGCASTDTAVLIATTVGANASTILKARRDGSSDTGNGTNKQYPFQLGGSYETWVVPLSSGVFEAWLSASGITGTSEAYVIGCFE